MKQFSASQATVERAVGRLWREGLIHRPAGTQRVVVREASAPATLRLCVVRPDWPSPVYDAVTHSIAAAGRGRDWSLESRAYRTMEAIDLAAVGDDYDAAVVMFNNDRVPAKLARAVERSSYPIVLAQDHREEVAACGVSMNDRQTANLAARHLLDLGHARPIFAAGSLVSGPMRHMLKGWRQTLREAGVVDADGLVRDAATPPRHDARYTVYEQWRALLTDKSFRPSAVFCANTAVAMGVMRALREAGLDVPRDVSIVAADALSGEAPYLNPPLTATTVDMSRFGEAVAQLIEAQINGTLDQPRQVWIDATLTVRESTAPFAGENRPGGRRR